MATKNNTATQQHVRLPADDPTTEALATYLVREEQHGLRDALLTAASLVAIARGYSTWITRNPSGDSRTPNKSPSATPSPPLIRDHPFRPAGYPLRLTRHR